VSCVCEQESAPGRILHPVKQPEGHESGDIWRPSPGAGPPELAAWPPPAGSLETSGSARTLRLTLFECWFGLKLRLGRGERPGRSLPPTPRLLFHRPLTCPGLLPSSSPSAPGSGQVHLKFTRQCQQEAPCWPILGACERILCVNP